MNRPNLVSITGHRGAWRWHLAATNGTTIGASTEAYKHRRGVADNIAQVLGVSIVAGVTALHSSCHRLTVRVSDGEPLPTDAAMIMAAVDRRPELAYVRAAMALLAGESATTIDRFLP